MLISQHLLPCKNNIATSTEPAVEESDTGTTTSISESDTDSEITEATTTTLEE